MLGRPEERRESGTELVAYAFAFFRWVLRKRVGLYAGVDDVGMVGEPVERDIGGAW